MPLIKGKSKKAFSKNVETEMHAGKPQDQALAIAYSIKRKKKKMASGGSVESGSKDMNYADGGEVSAANEKRPMPSERDHDAHMVAQNAMKKALVDSDWTDNPTIKQAQKPSLTKLSRPKFVGSDSFSVRDRDDVERDLDRMDSEAPDGYKNQPRSRYNEEGANRQGPKVQDMEAQHNNRRAPYKKEIENQYAQDEAESDMKASYAKGGEVDHLDPVSRIDTGWGRIIARAEGGPVMQPEDEGIERRERADEAYLMRMESPSEDEGASDARSRNEEGPDRQGPKISDNEEPHYMKSRQYHDSEENEDHEMELNPAHGKYSKSGGMSQPEDEAEEMEHASIAAAIMAKRKMMAEGGEINGMDSIYSDDSDQADLRRNAEEDANMEDQASFDALRKENYSESEGLEQLDNSMDSAQKGDDEESDSENKHDMISAIRSKMKSRRR